MNIYIYIHIYICIYIYICMYEAGTVRGGGVHEHDYAQFISPGILVD